MIWEVTFSLCVGAYAGAFSDQISPGGEACAYLTPHREQEAEEGEVQCIVLPDSTVVCSDGTTRKEVE